MKRSTAAALLAIVSLAAVLRLSPLLGNLHWGADYGEYYALTRSLATDGVVPASYRGWGVTYPYFPGALVLNAALVQSGLNADLAVSVLIPILASLSVLPAFLLAARVTGDDLSALLAATFVAVVAFHVYPTSHATAGAIGDLLFVAGLLGFLGLQRSSKWFLPLVLMGFAIIVTHHLTTYFLVLASTAVLWFRVLTDREVTLRSIRFEVVFLAVLIGLAFVYWFAYAPPFWSLATGASPVPPELLVAGAFVPLALLPLGIAVRRQRGWRFRPKVHSVRKAATIAAGIAGLSIVLFLVTSVAFPVPGSSVFTRASDVFLYAPTIAVFSIGAAGRRFLDFSREGLGLTAWLAALAGSFILGALLAPRELIPYRHLQYAMVPVAAMVGIGFRYVTSGARPRSSAFAVAAAATLLAGTAAGAFPPAAVLAGFDAAISPRAVEAALWLGAHGDGLIGGDHLVSTVVFGYAGLDATWDREERFWHTANVSEALQAMAEIRVAQDTLAVRWIVIDTDLREAVQLSPFAPATPLLAAEEAKFTGEVLGTGERGPFHKLYDSGYAQAYWFNAGLAP